MALEKELATFEGQLPNLLQTMKGRFVLIHGDNIDGSWETEDAAYVAGCERLGAEPFLVMLVEENEVPLAVLQDISPYAGNL